MINISNFLRPARLKAAIKWHIENLRQNKLIRKPHLADQIKLEEEEEHNWLASAILAFFIVGFVTFFWPNMIAPFKGMFSLWQSKGTVMDWMNAGIPAFIWGFGVTILVSIFTRNKPEDNANAEAGLMGGMVTSVLAGVLEEICFRWLLFLEGIISAIVFNFLFFGFLGFGIPQWLQVNLLGPLANFFTLGILQQYLTDPAMWAVGAGLLGANAQFRDGHKYLGVFGYLNSWFMGMFLFWIMFTYGLPAAILVHFVYDAGIYIIRYVDHVIERAFGNA